MNIFICKFLFFFFTIIVLTFLIKYFLDKYYFYKFNLLQQSFFLVLLWFVSALVFISLIWLYFTYYFNILIANNKFICFFLGYFFEQMLSLDNMLIWFILFEYFKIPNLYQTKVLNYGLFFAFILRSILIFISYWFFVHWNWIIFIFSLILLFSGLEMLLFCNSYCIKKNIFLIKIMRLFHVINLVNLGKFFIYKNYVFYITPLFIALFMIEMSDILFALDSIPSVFSFVRDPLLILTSNIFSILTLRSIYFIISSFIKNNIYIKKIIAFFIICIASKMIYENYIHILHDTYYFIISVILIIILIYNVFIHRIFY